MAFLVLDDKEKNPLGCRHWNVPWEWNRGKEAKGTTVKILVGDERKCYGRGIISANEGVGNTWISLTSVPKDEQDQRIVRESSELHAKWIVHVRDKICNNSLQSILWQKVYYSD